MTCSGRSAEAELRVEGRHRIDLAFRHADKPRNREHVVLAKIAELPLDLLQHRNEFVASAFE